MFDANTFSAALAAMQSFTVMSKGNNLIIGIGLGSFSFCSENVTPFIGNWGKMSIPEHALKRQGMERFEISQDPFLRERLAELDRRGRRRRHREINQFDVLSLEISGKTYRDLTRDGIKAQLEKDQEWYFEQYSEVGGSQGDRIIIRDDNNHCWLFVVISGVYQKRKTGELVHVRDGHRVSNEALASSA